MRKTLFFLVLALIIFTSVSVWMTRNATIPSPTAESTGKADIGGRFTLTDTDGKTVSDSDFRGRLMLVFFGFTRCPDICPITTATLSKTMGLLQNKADQVAPIFISVDPEYDTPLVLKKYLANFDKHMVGLTGTPEQIAQVAGGYKAYFAKKNVPWDDDDHDADEHEDHDHDMDHEHHHHEHAHGDEAKEPAYNVDHSGFVYLMDREGNYLAHFPYNVSEQQLADALKPYLH